MSTIEAADLARIILDDTETDRHMDLYTLTVIEARTLARAVIAVADLADLWESVVSSYDYEAAMQNAAIDLRTALNGAAA